MGDGGDSPAATALLAPDADRARARAARDARVDEIVELMSRGEWEGTRQTLALARAWDLSRDAVSDYAREASGIVRRMARGDSEDLKAEILAGVERLRLIATEHGRLDARGVQVALNAYELRMKALGLFPAQKLEIVTQEAWAALSVAEKRERLERAKQRIAILEAQLPPIEVEAE